MMQMPVYVTGCIIQRLTIFSPLILTADLLLFLWGEIIGNIERLADLLRRLSLDHVGDSLAADVKKGLNIKVIGGKDNLKKHLLINLHELLVPLLNVGGLLARVGIIVGWSWGVVLVVLAPFDNFLENGLVDIWDWDSLGDGSVLSEILHHIFDKHGALGNLAINFDNNSIVGLQADLGCLLFRHVDYVSGYL